MISQRLRGLNEEGEALEASFIPKLGKAFGDVGIQIMDQNGELRSTYDILSDLAAKWDDLSSAQRQYLGEKAAGNRQVKTLNAIMQNWDVVVDTIQKAEEAGGAALEGNAKYMDSIEGRIVQFQSAFQDLARTTIDSNMVKGLVSFGTEIVKITTNIGGLQKVLIPVLALLAISKWNSIVKGVKALGNAFKTTAGSVSGFRIGLSAVVAALSIATSAWDSYIAKQKEARANDIETGRTAVENAVNLSDAVAKYDALASITNRTQAQEEEFKQAVEDVNSALGDKKTILDDLTAGTDNYTKALHKATQEEIAQAKIEAQKAMNAARENVGQVRYGDNWLDTLTGMVVEPGVSMPTTQWNGLKEANDIYGEFYDTLTKVGKIYHDDLTGVDKIIPKFDNVDSYVEFYYTLKDIQDQLVQMQIDTGNSSFVDNKLYDQASEFVSEYESAVNDYISATYNALSLGKPLETVDDYNAIADSMVNLTHATGLYEEAIRSYVEVQASAAGVNADIVDAGQLIEETGDAASETTNKLKELATELSSTTESYKTLTEAIAEQDKAGVISSETYQKLIEENEAYNEMLVLTAEGYALNTEAVYDFIKAQGANQKLKALQEIKDRQDALEKLRIEQEELAKSWGNADAIADNQARQDQIQSEINGYAALIREIDAATGALARYNAAKSTKNQDENFNTGEQAYKDITEGLKTGKVGTDDFKSAIGFVLGENWEEELDRWDGSIEKAYQEAEKLGKRYFGQEDERTGMANYRDDLVKAGYATYNPNTGEMQMLDKTATGTLTTVENIAKSLGLSEDAVVSMFGLMESYGAHFEFPEIVTDDDIKKAKELADTVTETKEGGGEVNLSAVEQLQKARADMVQQLESYNKTLETADPEGAAYQHAAEQAGQLEAAIASVDKALEGLNLGEKEKSLTFEDTVQQITDLKQAITDMQTARLDIPVSLSGEVDKANALLNALGAEDGGKIVLTADKTNADSQITDIQTKLDAVKNSADIPVTLKAALESGSEVAIQQLQEISSGKYKDETVNVVIDATDNASPKITTITETKYNDIELQTNANDNATPEILGITAAEYDAYITIHAKREAYDKELQEIQKEELKSSIQSKKDNAVKNGNAGSNLFNKTGGANLGARKVIPSDWLADAGYDAGRGGSATVFSTGVQVGENGEVGVLVTPILPNGDVLEPDTFEEFVHGIVEKPDGSVGYEGRDLGFDPSESILGSVDLSKIVPNLREYYMEELGQALHEVQDAYYEGAGTISSPELPAETLKPQVEAEIKTENPDQVVDDAQNAADAEPVEVPVEAENPEEVPEQVQDAVDAAPPTEAEVKFAQDSIDQATQQVQDSASKSPVEMNAETVMETVVDAGSSVKEMTSIARDAGIATGEVENLNAAYRDLYDAADALDTAEPNTAEWDAAASDLQSAAQGFSSAYSALEVALGTLKPVTVNADTTPAIASINALANRTITIRANVTPSITQNAKGTNNAAEGISLVDEKGAELIEHTKQGTFELGTNKGPRFTQLEKGDVVHTATETKKILSRLSKVGGFFRNGLNQAKSIFSGGAFATGVSGGMSWNLINKTLKAVQNSNKKTTTTTKSTTTTKKSTKKTKSVSAKSLQKYTEKLFDWAEIRLERLKTITNTWLLNASEAIGYIAKNSELNNAIKSVEQEIENTTAAYDLYIKQAQTIADKAKLTDDIVQKIHDGEINIAEYDKNMQTKIQLYQEYYDKALACVDALTDLREQEKELARQRLDNIIDHYTYRVNNLESIVSQREADLELMAKQGVEIEASEYGISIDATAKKLEELLSERAALENEFKTAISQGFIEEESAEWYDYSEKLAEVDRAITETKTALIELNDTAKNVSITNLSWQLDALTNSADNINDFVNLHAAQALDETAETYLKLIENGMDQIRNLEEQNERYREQQAGLDVLSEKYQDLQSNIESNNRAIMDMKVSQEEWNDAVLDLEINRLNKFKDTLNKTNDEYQRQKELQEALQNLEKARAQRTMRIYRGADQGFVYEADQEAVRSAQTELEDVIENQLLDRIDDLISAIEEQKNDTNVYDANGVLLGSTYSTPQLAAFSDILSNYYGDIGSTSPFASLKSNLYDQLTSNLGGNGSNALNFSVGTMNINEVDNASEFAETIIDQLPNALMQAIYK